MGARGSTPRVFANVIMVLDLRFFITNMEISKTDLQKAIAYLNDAAALYEALGVMPVQKYVSRAHMIKQLIHKLKKNIPNGRKPI